MADGWMYFIAPTKAAGAMKIGFTTQLADRFKRLQMNSPVQLSLLVAVRGTRDDETEAHQVFKPWRRHGEWFERNKYTLGHVAFWKRHVDGSTVIDRLKDAKPRTVGE